MQWPGRGANLHTTSSAWAGLAPHLICTAYREPSSACLCDPCTYCLFDNGRKPVSMLGNVMTHHVRQNVAGHVSLNKKLALYAEKSAYLANMWAEAGIAQLIE